MGTGKENSDPHKGDTSAEGTPVKRPHNATVTKLDGTTIELQVESNAKGLDLFNRVADLLRLNEGDYFGLVFKDGEQRRTWLQMHKKISKQIKSKQWRFDFEVKFYPPEPTTLAEDITRYYLSLQVQRDVVSGKLPCGLATQALLGSYMVQALNGDWDVGQPTDDASLAQLFVNFCFAPQHTHELLQRVHQLHKGHKGQTMAEAELNYLLNAVKLNMYGVDLHRSRDADGKEIMLGVNCDGINVYNDQIRVNRYIWQKIKKISYRYDRFKVKLRAGEGAEKGEMSFRCPCYEDAKRVWQSGVEHHTFFRLMQPEERQKGGLLRLGSEKFAYNGRTQFQSRMAATIGDRPHSQQGRPHSGAYVQRSQSARLSSNADDSAVRRSIPPPGHLVDGTPVEAPTPLHFVDSGLTETATRTKDDTMAASPSTLGGDKSPMSEHGDEHLIVTEEHLLRHSADDDALRATNGLQEETRDERVTSEVDHEGRHVRRVVTEVTETYAISSPRNTDEGEKEKVIAYSYAVGEEVEHGLHHEGGDGQGDALVERQFSTSPTTYDEQQQRQHTTVTTTTTETYAVSTQSPTRDTAHRQGSPLEEHVTSYTPVLTEEMTSKSLSTHAVTHNDGGGELLEKEGIHAAENGEQRQSTRIVTTTTETYDVHGTPLASDNEPVLLRHDDSGGLLEGGQGGGGQKTMTTSTTTETYAVHASSKGGLPLIADSTSKGETLKGGTSKGDTSKPLDSVALRHDSDGGLVEQEFASRPPMSSATQGEEEGKVVPGQHVITTITETYQVQSRQEGTKDEVVLGQRDEGEGEQKGKGDDGHHISAMPITSAPLRHSGDGDIVEQPYSKHTVAVGGTQQTVTTTTETYEVLHGGGGGEGDQGEHVQAYAYAKQGLGPRGDDVLGGEDGQRTSASLHLDGEGGLVESNSAHRQGQHVITTTTETIEVATVGETGNKEKRERKDKKAKKHKRDRSHSADSSSSSSSSSDSGKKKNKLKNGEENIVHGGETVVHVGDIKGAEKDGRRTVITTTETYEVVAVPKMRSRKGSKSSSDSSSSSSSSDDDEKKGGKEGKSDKKKKEKKEKKEKHDSHIIGEVPSDAAAVIVRPLSYVETGLNEQPSRTSLVSPTSSSTKASILRVEVPRLTSDQQRSVLTDTNTFEDDGPVETYTETDAEGNVITRTRRIHTTTTVTSERVTTTSHGDGLTNGHPSEGASVTYERDDKQLLELTRGGGADWGGDMVACRTVQSGNRTLETVTYKTEKDGMIETHTEHRITIHTTDDIDHDAELEAAIIEATKMNPDMIVEKIEVKKEIN